MNRTRQAKLLTDNGNAVDGGNGADVVSGGNGTGDGSLALLSRVLDALAGEEGSTTLGSLEDDGSLLVASSLEGSDGSARGGDVAGRDSKLLLASVLEKLQDVIT